MGVDGWGRPYDVTGQCRALGADLLVLQESWAPDDGGPSTATRIAEALGHRVVAEVALCHGRLFSPHPEADERWGPPLIQSRKTLRLDGERWTLRQGAGRADLRPGPVGHRRGLRSAGARRGGPLLGPAPPRPGPPGGDPGVVDLKGGPITVHGTHMSHITHGSHAQYRLLGTKLPPLTVAAALAGDMNLWGPPVNSYVRGWRRGIAGRTWPGPRPHSQLDHVMVTPPVRVTGARVADQAGSDHRPGGGHPVPVVGPAARRSTRPSSPDGSVGPCPTPWPVSTGPRSPTPARPGSSTAPGPDPPSSS